MQQSIDPALERFLAGLNGAPDEVLAKLAGLFLRKPSPEELARSRSLTQRSRHASQRRLEKWVALREERPLTHWELMQESKELANLEMWLAVEASREAQHAAMISGAPRQAGIGFLDGAKLYTHSMAFGDERRVFCVAVDHDRHPRYKAALDYRDELRREYVPKQVDAFNSQPLAKRQRLIQEYLRFRQAPDAPGTATRLANYRKTFPRSAEIDEGTWTLRLR